MSGNGNGAHLPYLDGWRGLAIACLLLGHFFPVPGLNFGTIGVHLFFVLSGLLMTRILFLQKVPLALFYKRRIARIFPSVYVYLLVVTILFALSGREIALRELLGAATFTNNYLDLDGPWRMPFGHIWSLSVEEHAYVALSLIAVATRASRRRSLAAVGMATLAMAAIACAYAVAFGGARLESVWSHSEVAAFGIFASGLLLLCRSRDDAAPLHPLAIAALLALGLAAHWWSLPPPVRLLLGCGAFALALNWLHRAPGLAQRCLEWALLRRLGLWSYSIYLWQQPFYQLVHREGMHPALGLALSLLVGIAAFYAVEQPARSWLNRRWARPAPPPAELAPLGCVNPADAGVASDSPTGRG